ncbi:hypothetical protein Tco_1123148 [Tanacetum coccineum]|uniref:Reverse transcriptase domain-containing protein n=1 Tax=Tanacetum coccineum TaxID=301880 RepID=A0ABQ5J532_9ASTR
MFSRLRREGDKPTRRRSPVSTIVFTRLGHRDGNVFTHLGERRKNVHSRLGPEVVPRRRHASERMSASSNRSAKDPNHRNKDARSLICSYVTCSSECQREIEEEWSNGEDDLSQPWLCEETDPFTARIRYFKVPKKTRMPSNVKTYDGTGDPEDHLKYFQAAAKIERWAMPTWCHMFNSTLIGSARAQDRSPPLTKTPKENPDNGDIKIQSTTTYDWASKRIRTRTSSANFHVIKRHARRTRQDKTKKGKPPTKRKLHVSWSNLVNEMTRKRPLQPKLLSQAEKSLSRPSRAASDKENPIEIEAEVEGHLSRACRSIEDQLQRRWEHSTSKLDDLHGVRSPSPYRRNHRPPESYEKSKQSRPRSSWMLKIPRRGRNSTIRKNWTYFAWRQRQNMTASKVHSGTPPEYPEGCPPIRQKRRAQASDTNKGNPSGIAKLVE